MSRIAVVGVGAIGCVFGGYLAATGRHEMIFCSREIFSEVSVESDFGEINATAHTVMEPTGLEPADWLFLATKAHQVGGTAGWLEALCGPNTRVAVLQNGVDHVERVSPFAGQARVMPVVVSCPALKHGPGRVSHIRQAGLTICDDESGQDFADLFLGANVRIELSADMTTSAWRKLCNNMSSSAITVLTNEPYGVFRHTGLLELSAALLEECIAVGRAEGALLGDGIIDEVMAKNSGSPPDLIPSMLGDHRAGRPVEVDAQYGIIVRLGERHGIKTPLCRAVVALLETINSGK